MDDMTRQVGHAHPRPALPPTGVPEDLNGFLDWLGEAIPLVGSLGIQRMREEGNALVWELDLRPNLNDKGTGFGGSLTAQTTLLGWCWTTLWLRRRGINQDVVVAQASQRFVAPVTGDYRLICRPEAPGDDRAMLDSAIAGETSPEDALERRLAERGKGRIALVQELWCGETLCLEARGDYAVLPSEPPIAV
ncbi:YiiD C-terminal domain-containing protein [Halomonas litopenaei]|uniref:YiiD C-terminal domain-containing protein n=1 Tax=Halomonas litopenaei TaxID=2109328 RepID=UPI003D6C848A